MDWNELTKYLDAQENEGIPGSEIVVYRDHERIYHHCAGYSDEQKRRPTDGSELYWLYSASKVSTCTAMMQLIEQKKANLDDSVSQYLPAFGSMMVRERDILRPAKRAITIRHLMSMQSGLNYNLNSPSLQKAREFYGRTGTTRQMIDALAQEPLDFEPGTYYQYSLSHDVLGAVIEAISGMRLADYLKANLYEPLGMCETTMIPTREVMDRLAARYRVENQATRAIENQTNAYRITEQYDAGGAGVISSACDYALLADALACGGVGKSGAQILTGESIDQMRTPQLCEEARKIFRLPGRPGYTYGLGVRVMVEPQYSRSPAGEFGWDGAAGAFLMAIPEKRLSLFYVQHVLSCSHAFEVIHPTIRDLVCQIVDA